MLKKLILFIILIIVVLAGYAMTKPDTFRVERSIVIDAPANAVFEQINDLHEWTNWSPWEHIDPNMDRKHSGANAGLGAIYEWQGNNEVGQGRMEIVKSLEPELVKIKLDFIKPFEAHNFSEFTIKAEDNSQRVTWAMYGPQPFITKLMTVFVSMDQMVGKDFEKGLSKLRATAEE